ncbi:MAG: hypothetical protein EOP62_03570 [Sphingomonadales bacterium]|nr:MAG: hypothetical protein EOP62_03570 [Sphingomonadales bacterium]
MILALLLALAGSQDVPARAVEGTNVAKPAQDADGTQRWSLMPETCKRDDGEIMVCGTNVADTSVPRLPLPGERGPPDRPMPSNPDISGSGALAASAPPCATLSQGCATGMDIFGGGTFLVRAIGKIIDNDSCCEEPGEATNIGLLIRDTAKAVKKVGRKKPDKSNRVPILLDDPALPATGATAAPTP